MTHTIVTITVAEFGKLETRVVRLESSYDEVSQILVELRKDIAELEARVEELEAEPVAPPVIVGPGEPTGLTVDYAPSHPLNEIERLPS